MTDSRGPNIGFAWLNMSRPTLIALISVSVIGGVSAGASDETQRDTMAPRASSQPQRTRALDVTILTRSDDGHVLCALWPDAEGFPSKWRHAAYDAMSNQPKGQRAHIRFAAIAQGEYALACFHDENNNNSLDTNLVGIPSEGTGASNGAHGFMGPPRYKDALFVISQNGPDALTIRIDY